MKNKIQLTEISAEHISEKLLTEWVQPSGPHGTFRPNPHTAAIHRSGVWIFPQLKSAKKHKDENKIQPTEMTVEHISAKLFTVRVEPSDPPHTFRSNLHTASIHRSGVWTLPHQPSVSENMKPTSKYHERHISVKPVESRFRPPCSLHTQVYGRAKPIPSHFDHTTPLPLWRKPKHFT